MSRIRLLPLLFGISAVLSAIILAPLSGGYLLYRDAVSTPDPRLTDAALGLGELPARAVPQDWLLAVLSPVVDGGIATLTITFAALLCAGVGYGRAAHRLVPGAGRAGASAAAVLGIWNPWVAERLLQGHWSLLTGYAALGWLLVAAAELRERPSTPGWLQLAALCAAAGLTPTGSVLAGVLLVAALVIPVLLGAGATAMRRWAVVAAAAVCWVIGALPWLTATAVGGASTASSAAGVAAFGLRSEPWSGPVGTALGLGGIWNAEAVPASRTMGWAAIATVCLMLVVVIGAIRLWRDRHRLDPVVGAAAAIAGAVIGLVAAAYWPGAALLEWLVSEVPGGGLLRDTTKYLALAVPFYTLAAAATVVALRVWVPAAVAVLVVVLLVVAPLPDLAWGVGGKLRSVEYPADYTAARHLIPADAGAVAIWPEGTVRRYDFADTASLNPLPRMLAAPVIESGELIVDGVVVDPASDRSVEVSRALGAAGTGPLGDLGIGWVIVEGAADPPRALAGQTPVFDGEVLRIYRVDDPVIAPGASTTARVMSHVAHGIWLLVILAGAISVLVGRAGRRPPRIRRR